MSDTNKVKITIYGDIIVADLAVPHSSLRNVGYDSKVLVTLAMWLKTVRYIDDDVDYTFDMWHIKIYGSIIGIMQYRRQLIEELSRDTPYKSEWVIDVKHVNEKDFYSTRQFYEKLGIPMFHTDYGEIFSPIVGH